ncbi:MAG: hypothetical protein HYR85_08325, partial [Planctomycetes bacterium]|nr:hypothetical protein [Planctomycetota bacterium]
WPDTKIERRQRIEGAAVAGQEGTTGLPIPPQQLMPFFLAARSAAQPDADLLSEALCSSYEAFRFTRKSQDSGKDEPEEEPVAPTIDLSRARWYLGEFDRALESCNGSAHPKVCVTVKRVVDLWEQGEKVLIFAFYRRTCRALRVHISEEIERRLQRRVGDAGLESSRGAVERLVERIQKRYFDDLDSSARRSVDAALEGIVQAQTPSLDAQGVTAQQRDDVVAVMRRFLRVSTTLIRCFPIVDVDKIKPARAVATMLDSVDSSAVPWRTKFDRFVAFLTEQCSEVERRLCLEAALKTQTGGIRVEDDDEGDARSATLTLANVQVATGKTNRETRARLMRAFNTPFFPDILVCSEVMGEGVDLQRSCRHVIHHDLAWNPSTIEQRTGRIDRLGCKAEGRHPIVVYLPYLDGAADERQFRVMRDREQWFRVVMGQDEVARLITRDSGGALPLPAAISDELTFDLGIGTAPR